MIRLHALTEGTITSTNGASGAADTVESDYNSSVISFTEKDLFNTTIKNQEQSLAYLMGFLVRYDVTSLADATDKDILHLDVELHHAVGAAISTQDVDQMHSIMHRLAANPLVEGGLAGGEDVPYSIPAAIKLFQPIPVSKTSNVAHYIGATTVVHRDAWEAISVASNAVVVKVAAAAVILDADAMSRFKNVREFWDYMLG
jgi:hypothetical protein